MLAKDVMTDRVVTVSPETTVEEIAQTLLENRISAVPVVDSHDRLAGLVSEGDLMRQLQDEGDRRGSWWLEAFTGSSKAAADFVKAHGTKAEDIMTRDVVTVAPTTPVHEIAKTLETRRIKRVPVVEDSRVLGIVSRANLLHGLASAEKIAAPSGDDRALRVAVVNAIRAVPAVDPSLINVTVRDAVVTVWGVTDTDDESRAVKVAVEETPGVSEVHLQLGHVPAWAWGL